MKAKKTLITNLLIALGLMATPLINNTAFAADNMAERQQLIAKHGANTGYIMGLFPGTVEVFDATSLLERYLPFSNYLSKASGTLISFAPERNVGAFKKKVQSSDYPIVYVNAEIASIAINKGYEPLVKRSDPIVSVVMTLTDSPIKELKDLDGKKIGAISQAMVSSLAFYTFYKEGVKPAIQDAGGTGQDQLILNLDTGLLDGIILREETAKKQIKKAPDKYKVALNTGIAPGFILMVKSDLPEQTKANLRQAMLSIDPSNAVGAEILKGMDGAGTVYQDITLDELKKMEVIFKTVAELKEKANSSKKTGETK